MTHKKSHNHKKHSKKCCPPIIIISDKKCHKSSTSSDISCTKKVTPCFSKKCCKSKSIEVVKKAVDAFASGNIPLFLAQLAPNATLVFNGPNPPIPFAGTYNNLVAVPNQTTPTIPEFFIRLASASSIKSVVTQSIQFNCGFERVTSYLTIKANIFCPGKHDISFPIESTFIIEHTFNDECKIQTLEIFANTAPLAIFYSQCNMDNPDSEGVLG